LYCDVLRQKRPGKWRTNNWVPHHDNAPAHTALAVQQFLASKHMTVGPHPPYAPDLAPCDFFLYPKMKIKLNARRFDTVEEIQAEPQKVLKTLTQKDFQDSFRSWQKRWDRCARSQRDCFEGDGGD
jgi:transposase